jgi:glutamate-1-semialdehyde 2,1-aminomutase
MTKITEREALDVAIEAAYRERTPTSEHLWCRAADVYPSGVSGAAKFFLPYPLFIAAAEGAEAVDVDGNRYVDLLMGAGPLLLGHSHPRVVEAVREQAARMVNPMMPTELSHLYAERIRGHMPYLERLRFTNTGSEATRTALRVARAATGRLKLAKFEGGFHGSDDAFLVSTHADALPGSPHRPDPVLDYAGLPPRLLEEVVTLPYNDPETASRLIDEHGHELAAVIMEPVAFSSGGGVPATKDFARAVRDAASRNGVVLIFDEVVCAYRMGLAGAPAYLEVVPDLATIGKAIGGGLPLAAIGGRADLMEATLGIESGDRQIFQSGTFTENPLSIAAGSATLDVLESEPVLERADAAGESIRSGLAELFAEFEIEAAVTGTRSVFQVHLGTSSVQNRRDLLRSDREATRLFLLALVAEQVLWPPVHPAVTSGVHDGSHVDRVLSAAQRVLARASGNRR